MKRFVFLIGILMIASGVFAEISISEPEEIYNLGDRLYIDLGGLRGANNGNLDINLVCGNSSINMVRIPARAFAMDEDQTYSVPYKVLDWEDLGVLNLKQIVGTCQIVASMGSNFASSKTFEISDDISVTTTLDKPSYNPGEEVVVVVDAVKANGDAVNGFVEGANASYFNSEIVDGKASVSFVVGDNAEAGVYYLSIRAYDVGGVSVLNEGRGFVSYAVNQVASSLVLSLSDVVAVPENNFSIGLLVFDQSGKEMIGSANVKIISPDGKEVENIVAVGDSILIDFESNSSVGTWKILSRFDNLAQEREFEMMPLQKVDFDFEESVLVVRNVGNVLYNKTIEVLIGEEVMVLDLNIEVGEVRKFSLKAPVGSYDVRIGDGEYEETHQVLLTGNAISISDFNGLPGFSSYYFIWIFLIVLLGSVGVVMGMRYRKTRRLGESENFFTRFFDKFRGNRKEFSKRVSNSVPLSVRSRMDESLNFTKKSPAIQGLDSESYGNEDKSMVDFTKKGLSGAESSLVLKGEKYVSGVVALSVKNFESLSDVASDGLDGIVDRFKGKGLVDHRGEFIFIVFSPLITRTYGNEGLAVRCAMNIFENLNNYNKKFRDKIDFGIGVHVGDLVASKEAGKLKYTGIGNTISFAKRMSDVNSGRVVISDEIRKRLLRELKVSKGKEISGRMTYVVDGIKDMSHDQDKLREILSRNKE
jgi:class 3 adenylate cyclase